mmetsp:Transcript_50595/g.122093  ORF Transcript_50595/g.122093 Transcript_50595/m.122093 type:complete len:628 (-) Transcript_50595:294-2177(-)|eukprot:CAMPEP_0113467498 /NCGR_PEP_ID=MMETSP0014_2-20120614/14844_1 /TAXON_ID=2857 /ORGANISM="Nitzschia sp." /LENGTH=627 /DNA_ID=CAMNT_0000359805 /DNA_START=92 /DNA_END=1975 /DNA_ORIENTATION=+ /assembly_acc=CAM_ASM_000159
MTPAAETTETKISSEAEVEVEGDNRKLGISNLIELYRSKYQDDVDNGKDVNSNAFYIHPAVEFVHSDNDESVSVRVTQQIQNGTTLVRLPKEERVSLTVDDGRRYSNDEIKILKSVLKKIKTKFHQKIDQRNSVYTYGDVGLAVVIMYDLTKQKLYTKAWPSPQTMKKHYYPLWDPASFTSSKMESLLQGTYTIDATERFWTSLKDTFDRIVGPVLLQNDTVEFVPRRFRSSSSLSSSSSSSNSTSPTKDEMWDAFLYASSLVRSRSHGGSEGSGDPEIIPVVDLVNGVPSSCQDEINVEVQGSVIKDQKTNQLVVCSDLSASRSIEPGQELMLSYGDITASASLVKYAFCPAALLKANAEPSVDVVLVKKIPSCLGPTDDLRRRACYQLGGIPVDDLEGSFVFEMNRTDLETYRSTPVLRGESDNLGSFRQFLLFAHILTEEEVRSNLATGRLRCQNMRPEVLGLLHLVMIDHLLMNVTTLGTSTNAEDINASSDAEVDGNIGLAAIYRARISQRDTIARWRHAFCRKYNIPSEHTDPKHTFTMAQSMMEQMGIFLPPPLPRPSAPSCLMKSRGCWVCGRTLGLKGCSKCKSVCYCGRDHQILHWKQGHKAECDPAFALDAASGLP